MRTFKILFADDDLGHYEGDLSAYLTAHRPNWELHFARSQREANEILDAQEPDAVVLDVELSPGGREGMELLLHVRKHHPSTPVIMLSGSTDARSIRDSFLSETVTDDLEAKELDPEGFFFKDEILATGNYGALEKQIAAGLFKYGRVSNENGILVTHGTDTMAWGLAYLRYALKNLKSNVALTGSQVPLEGYFSASDALGNLRTAIFLLNRLRPAHLFAVFNNGKAVFSGRLTKFRKWDTDAFDGRMAASASSDGIRTMRKDWVTIPYEDQRLANLHLVRTGGTIESQRGEQGEGPLQPTGDFVWKYVNETLSDFFVRSQRHDLFALDSSNMSFEQWARLAEAIERIGVAEADTRFDPSVKPVYTNPVFTTADYTAQFAVCGKGAVLAGYGGGNANVLEESPHSVLPALSEAIAAGKFVAVTSQVPLEPYDAEYETGLSLIEAGGVPCGDLPLADAQVKLSYLLGHSEEMEAAASAAGLDPLCLRTASFLAGVTMRKAASLRTFRHVMRTHSIPLKILPQDPFVARSFAQGLKSVVEALKN
jgi:L-asparaginase/Glu-tRNA(Gln) amidotransferase subunit D